MPPALGPGVFPAAKQAGHSMQSYAASGSAVPVPDGCFDALLVRRGAAGVTISSHGRSWATESIGRALYRGGRSVSIPTHRDPPRGLVDSVAVPGGGPR